MLMRCLVIAVAVIGAIMFAFSLPAKSEHMKSGDRVNVYAYCADPDNARELAALVVAGGDAGYWKAIKDPVIKCWDTRYHGTRVVQATLYERIWTVVHKDGTEYEFWEARSVSAGTLGYVWIYHDESTGSI